MLLSELFPGAPAIEVTGLAWDSRRVRPGEVFFAIPGQRHDGHDFIPQAISQGAVAVVGERSLTGLPVPYLRVPDARAALARAAAAFYGHPTRRLHAIGVTGTDGKTTIVHFLGQLLPRCEVLSTVRVEQEGLSCVTTPEAPDLQRLAHRALVSGQRFFAFEASSIGLSQRRVEGVELACAVFTGLSRDHLDFHGNLAQYLEAKLRILELLRERGCLVVNGEDLQAQHFLKRAAGKQAISYGLKTGDLRATWLREGRWEIELGLEGPRGKARARLPFLGLFNVQNALAAAAVAIWFGLPLRQVARRLARLRLPPGRLQRFLTPAGVEVIVDYAHTPAALRKVLELLRPRAKRLIAVFGAAGESDRGKRPLMGRAAGELADFSIITSDNPKGEDPLAIARAVASGVEAVRGAYEIELERGEAVRLALAQARPGDIVLLAGKGHERYQQLAGGAVPYSDSGFLLANVLAYPAG